MTYIKLWGSFKDLQKNELKIYGTCSTVDILSLNKNLVFFLNLIFLALIDNPNNIKINRLIWLVVSGMFLLPQSATFMSLVSFLVNFF